MKKIGILIIKAVFSLAFFMPCCERFFYGIILVMKIYQFFILQKGEGGHPFVVRVFLGIIFLIFIFTITPLFSVAESKQILYTESQLQNLISPSVVRVVQHIQGTAQVPSFIIDFSKRTIVVDTNKDTARVENVDTNIIGSGVIVSPNGHILTNAHLVSDTAVKLAVITPYMREDILKAGNIASGDIEKDKAFGIEIKDFILKNSIFALQKEIVILNPVAQNTENNKENFSNNKQLIFLANVLYVNNNFYKGSNNIAVIKIDNKNLPSLVVANINTFSTGEKLYTLEVPTLSDFTNLNDFNSEGAYAFNIKETFVDTDNTNQNHIYTKTKFTAETSGSPLFNGLGNIVGLLTSDGQISYGQPINMFVVPNSDTQPILTRAGVVSITGSYARHFKRGFEYSNNGFCDESSKEFELALSNKTPFTKNLTTSLLLPSCNSAIKKEAQSQTNKLGFLSAIQNKFTSSGFLDGFIVILVVILFLTLLIAVVVLIKSFNKHKSSPALSPEYTRSVEVSNARRKPLTKVLPKTPNNNDLLAHFYVTESESDKITQASTQDQSLHIISKNEQEHLAQLWPDKYTTQPNKNNTENIQQATNNEILTDKRITDYIEETQNQGFSEQDIRVELLRVGWSVNDIDTAFAYIKNQKENTIT